MIKILLFIALLINIFSPQVMALDVTYVTNTNALTPYWKKTYAVAKAAAKDLDINITFVHGSGHRIYQKKIIAGITEQENTPDLVIFTAHPLSAFGSFTLLEQKKIPFITLSNFELDRHLESVRKLGKPQKKFSYWLAEHYDDQLQGSSLLINNLLNHAKSKLTDKKKLKTLALSGDFFTFSIQRSLAVVNYIKNDPRAILVQDIVAYWQEDDAKNKFKTLYQRHQGIDVVWASSDIMAIGALKGAKELGLIPNQDIFIGGFDWDNSAIEYIKNKQLTASVGGHFYSIAWLLVKVYDHFNFQRPFDDYQQAIHPTFVIIDQINLATIQPLTELSKLDQINFYCFSKTHTRKAKYDFSFTNLLKQLSSKNKNKCP
jgi:ABC-type sugar transport system substrate-binding protein